MSQATRYQIYVQETFGGNGRTCGTCHFDGIDARTASVQELLEHQLTRSRVQVRLELADELPTVMGDDNKLQQVFLNLILNALQRMLGEASSGLAQQREGGVGPRGLQPVRNPRRRRRRIDLDPVTRPTETVEGRAEIRRRTDRTDGSAPRMPLGRYFESS